jgi:hypothetical protein
MEIVGNDDMLNRSEKIWRLPDRYVAFGAMQYEDDKKKYQGQPHDLYFFDELPEFSRSQFIYATAWNRTNVPGQRCRVVGAGNPPTDAAGSWVIEEWAPWLDEKFAEPAKPGELRWYYRDSSQKLHWFKSGEAKEVNGETYTLRSRTFIPARLKDNPHLTHDAHYSSVLQSLPEPLRSQLLKGDFSASIMPNPWQIIPTDWVRAAQARWKLGMRPTTPISSAGVDCARGGMDQTVIARRHDAWFDYVAYAGIETPDGPTAAAKVIEYLANETPAFINVDVIGIGSSVYDHLRPQLGPSVRSINVSMPSEYRDRSGALKMRNLRAEQYWRMRDALDPEHGDGVSLPPSREVLADMCSARYKLTTGGVLAEAKDAVVKRIGRSPDVGDALMLANLIITKPTKKQGWIS